MDLDPFRSYLLLLARIRLGRNLQGKLDPSDIVQQTMIEAHQALESFRGDSPASRAAWLRQILARNIANAIRDLTREKRDVTRERSLGPTSKNRPPVWKAGSRSISRRRASRRYGTNGRCS